MNNIRKYHIADDLKCAFIDYVLSRFGSEVIIGHEIMYGSKEQFADLIILHKGYTYAVEVKSDSDNLNRIDNQIEAYRKLFNYVVVVCGEKHKSHLQESLPEGIGLFEVTRNSVIKKIRRPRRETSGLDKQEMLLSIRASYLSHKTEIPVSHRSAHDIRNQFAKEKISNIQEILYNYWYSRLSPGYKSFISNRGNQTLPNDLANFSTFIVTPNV